jgi:hypothetical protein
MQSIFVVHGRPGMSAAMAISLARKHNAYKSLVYKTHGSGDTLAVTAIATLNTGEKVETTVDMAMAKKAGWTKNAIYASIPEQMLKYRAATFLIRSNFPEVLFGMQTVEEIEDVEASKRAVPVKPIMPATTVIDVKNEPDPVKEEVQTIEEAIQTEPVIEEDAMIEDMVIERDIEDYRGEIREFLSTRDNDWFAKIGKSRGEMVAKVEAENSLDKMKHFYDFIQKIG